MGSVITKEDTDEWRQARKRAEKESYSSLATESGIVAGRPAWRPGRPTGARVINLKERNLDMLKNDLILRNPLRLLGHENEAIVPEGGFGAVLARAGVGKTALIVQVALNTMLQHRNVLHVSLDDPVEKVNLWYQQVLNSLAHQYHVRQIKDLWESIQMNRFIMTFKVEGFSVPKLEERVKDLTEQQIFNPHMVIIDGLPFDDRLRGPLEGLKAFSENHRLHLWFTVTTHRHEEPAADGLPVQLSAVADLFDAAIQLQPEGNKIHIRSLKGGPAETRDQLLDPATMLIMDH
ncbi:AAA family ATPase [uncultured Desulfosarcina sp.]|uniref:AAA family ATPase n=1 Tax=uncultured Desulfosarcina sp. TaxID=218289 RepID=UPI0029C909E5|nr:AAA family ATPase [uncultured Desulfosarcina sp.]